jgi:CheY-like chemotaxis protein
MGVTSPNRRLEAEGYAWRILVVDDEPSNLQVVERFLEDTRYAVSVADGAREALDVVEEEGPFDLYVLDVMMPEMRGTELAERIRQRQPGVPILFFTAFSNALFTGRRALQDGEAFIQKPVSKRDLLEAISLLLFNDLRGPRQKPARDA